MIKKYILEIRLVSDTLAGSGEGWGGVIDSDVVFDDYGLPYIPARRLRGCLREAGMELEEVLSSCKTDLPPLKELFGTPGMKESAKLSISNGYLYGYDKMRQWLQWISSKESKYNEIYSPETLLECFTALRNQTAIEEDEVALDNSLRTSRVLAGDLTFRSDISLSAGDIISGTETFLALSAAVFRRMGKMRNRGFGEIKCRLLELENEANIIPAKIKELEEQIEWKGGE